MTDDEFDELIEDMVSEAKETVLAYEWGSSRAVAEKAYQEAREKVHNEYARLTAELAAALKRAEAAEQSESGLARALTTAMAELVALREQTRWIPVSERLPEENGDVAVLLTDKAGVAWFNVKSKQFGYFDTDWVTHWMPLPQPPEAE